MKTGMSAMVDTPSGCTYEPGGVPTEAVQAVPRSEIPFVQPSETEFESPKSKSMPSRRAGPKSRAESMPATGHSRLAERLQRHRQRPIRGMSIVSERPAVAARSDRFLNAAASVKVDGAPPSHAVNSTGLLSRVRNPVA